MLTEKKKKTNNIYIYIYLILAILFTVGFKIHEGVFICNDYLEQNSHESNLC